MWKRRWWIPALAVVLIAAVGGAWYGFANHHHQSADDAMAARAQQVMPFDLNRTTHTFTQTPQGGVEKVVVNEPSDTHDRDLIRSHLQAEAADFRHGNYSDPAQIHGMNMPGIYILQSGAAASKSCTRRFPVERRSRTPQRNRTWSSRSTNGSTAKKPITASREWAADLRITLLNDRDHCAPKCRPGVDPARRTP